MGGYGIRKMFMGLDMSSNMAILNAFDAILPHRISAIADNSLCFVSPFQYFCFHLQES